MVQFYENITYLVMIFASNVCRHTQEACFGFFLFGFFYSLCMEVFISHFIADRVYCKIKSLFYDI